MAFNAGAKTTMKAMLSGGRLEKVVKQLLCYRCLSLSYTFEPFQHRVLDLFQMIV
jgi:hypothetical protein